MISELIKEIYPMITKSAPVIASALGINKIGEASMWALYLIGKAFGVSMKDVINLPAAISTDPDSDHKLSQLEQSFAALFSKSSTDVIKNLKVSDIELNLKVSFDQSCPTQSLN